MKKLNVWNELFRKAAFNSLDRRMDILGEAALVSSKIIFSDAVNTFHPERKKEFIMGRVCACQSFKECFGEDLLNLPANTDRSPVWPSKAVGSISHNKNWAGAAVAKSSDLIGLGIDFELIGRAKPEISSHITTGHDLVNHPSLSEEELLTLIFSSKESLYKALYPIIKKFFGFQAAALREVDTDNGSFVIELLTDLSEDFGPASRHVFHGRFAVNEETCLTVLEIS